MPSKSWVLLSALLVVSCVSPAQHDAVAPVEVVRAKRAVPQAVISGVLTAPSHLIGNNSSGLVGNNGGNWRVLAIDEAPVPGAEVFLADAGGQRIAKLPAVQTDAEGRFTIKGVPAGFTFVLMGAFKDGEGQDVRLQTVVTSGKSQKAATISLASTLVTQAAIEKSAGLLGELDTLSLETSIIALAAELTAADALLAADREAARTRVEELTQTNQQLQVALAALEEKLATGGQSTEALEELEEKIEEIQETVPVPTPTPTRPAPTPTPSPKPEATATPPVPDSGLRLTTLMGLPGDTVTVQGLGVEAMMLPIKVSFNGAAAQTAIPFLGLMGVKVPAGATSGPVTVQVGTAAPKPAGKFEVLKVTSETRLDQDMGPVAVDAQGNAWVGAVDLSGDLYKVSAAGARLGTFEVDGEVGGIAFDAEGNAWVAYVDGIAKVSPNGVVLAEVEREGEPYGIVRDGNGAIWVADHAGTLVKMGADGQVASEYAIASAVHGHGLALGQDGHFWVADNDRSRVLKLSPEGAVVRDVRVGARPEAVAVDGQGNVWVTNSGAKTVSKVSPAGAVLGTFTVGNRPMRLAIDPLGRVWVACEADDTVVVLAADGAKVAAIEALDGPIGVARGGDHRMWITAAGSRKLYQLEY